MCWLVVWSASCLDVCTVGWSVGGSVRDCCLESGELSRRREGPVNFKGGRGREEGRNLDQGGGREEGPQHFFK